MDAKDTVISGDRQIRLKPVLWGLVLGCCGFALNWFKLELFYGTDFIFGSFFVMLAAARFGLAAGIIAGFTASLCTFIHWNHPWSIIIFTFEALAVGWLYKRRLKDLAFADILFWLTIGIPISWFLHHHMQHMPMEHSFFISTKQAVNGTFNALAASVINLILQVRSSRDSMTAAPAPPLRNILFNVSLSLILIPVLFVMITDIRGDIGYKSMDITHRLSSISESSRDITAARIDDSLRDVEMLSKNLQGYSGMSAQAIHRHLEITRGSGRTLSKAGLFNEKAVTVAFTPPFDEEGRSTVGLDLSRGPKFSEIFKNNSLVTDIISSKIGRPSPLILISSPVEEGAKITGHLVASLDLSLLANYLKNFALNRGITVTLLDSRKNIIVSSADSRVTGTRLDLLKDKIVTRSSNSVSLATPYPVKGVSSVQRNLQSFFFKELPLGVSTQWTILIEAPLKPYIDAIRAEAQERMIQMLAIILLAGISSYLLSMKLASPISELALITSEIPKRIIEKNLVKLPSGGFRELQDLCSNISTMSESLKAYLERLKEANETLEHRVAERTREIEKSEQRFRMLVEDVPNLPVQGYDRNRRVIFWNKASEGLYGYSREEAFGRLLEELIIPPEMKDDLIKAVDNWVNNGVPIPAGELMLQGKGGNQVHVFSSHVQQIDHSGEPVLYCIDVDISQRMQAEAEIIKLNNELEQILSERTAELNFSNRELEGFCYAISHELRAPIARLQGFCEAMKEECTGESDGFKTFYAERIDIASRQLRHVVDSILLLSRLSRTELSKVEVNLSELAQQIANAIAISVHPRTPNFMITPGVSALCDRQLLEICLENLLGNAVKYSSKKEGSLIEFGVTSQNGERVYFVRDNGAGFNMAYADKLFKPFLRLHNENEFPGTGIGLVTVARIVERHGGRIRAEGIEGKGATFWFTLGEKG